MFTCALCRRTAGNKNVGDLIRAECRVCGSYVLSGTVSSVLESDEWNDRRYVLSGLARQASEAGRLLRFTSYNLENLIASARLPTTPFEVMDRLLALIHDRLPSLTGRAQVDRTDYPLLFLRDRGEFKEFLEHLAALKWITLEATDSDARGAATWLCQLTLKGWERIPSISQSTIRSNQAFVAMSFDESLDRAWLDGLKPGIESAGYDPLRLDELEHNDKICDLIVAEVRRSALLVADFTGHRGGVYFEAGLALGAGIPVIWTVRESDYADLHFDTRQYNFVRWQDPEELRGQLETRIAATLPVHPVG